MSGLICTKVVESDVHFRKTAFAACLALALGGTAYAAAPVTVGATVYDPNGGVVGTVEAVNGDVATVTTGTNKVGLPVSAFGSGAKGPVIAMTRDQLDAAAAGAKADAQAQLKAQLAPGATLYDTAGQPVGTIDASDDSFVTLAVDGQKVKIPTNAVTKGDKGAVIGMTAAQLKAAAAANAAQSATPPGR